MYTGDSINETEKKLKFTNIQNGRYYIGTKDVGFDHVINYNNGVRIPEEYIKYRIAHAGCVLLCIEGGSAGRKIAITNKTVCFGNKLCCFNSFSNSNKEFLYFYLQSPAFTSVFKDKITGIIGGVSINNLKELYVPLPPLPEQERIVDKLKELEPYIQEYDIAYEKIEELNNDFPEQLKKSILQEAVQGKLVPQNPNDEPASVLIERIREEKQKLIQEKKIKKDKNESYIFRRDNSHYEKIGNEERCIDDEIPFDIPDNWEWARFKEVFDIRDGTHDSPKSVIDGIPLITSKDFENGKINFKNAKLISKEDHKKIQLRSYVDTGDILYSMIGGNIGNMVIVNKDRDFSIKNVALFKYYSKSYSNPKFLKIVLESITQDFKNQAIGGAQQFVSLTFIRNYLIPLPPLAEQQRIVEKIEQLLPEIKTLQK